MDESKATALVHELREKVLSAVERMAPDDVHPNDIERFEHNDKWVLRFLQAQEFNMDQAENMAIECFKWRKKFGVHDIKETALTTLLKTGAIYDYTRDKFGNKILMFHVRMHTRDPELMLQKKKVLAYWVEKMDRTYNGEKITVIFDMSDTGLANMDLELMRFFVSLLKYYYPFILARLLVYEMPWILNAAWKIIKNWIQPKSVEKVKFLNKSTIQEYVAADQLPVAMGGTNTFKYVYRSNDVTSITTDLDQILTSSTSKKKLNSAYL